jgi:hypothetical protein
MNHQKNSERINGAPDKAEEINFILVTSPNQETASSRPNYPFRRVPGSDSSNSPGGLLLLPFRGRS